MRKILKTSNFHWFVDYEPVVEGSDFQPNRILMLDESETCYAQLDEIDEWEIGDYADTINYVFIDY